jgi:hypothetical protein
VVVPVPVVVVVPASSLVTIGAFDPASSFTTGTTGLGCCVGALPPFEPLLLGAFAVGVLGEPLPPKPAPRRSSASTDVAESEPHPVHASAITKAIAIAAAATTPANVAVRMQRALFTNRATVREPPEFHLRSAS